MEPYNSISNYLCDNKYTVLINFLSTLIGAFLGFLFALIIYWITEFNRRRDEKQAEKIKAFNTLNRFLLLINSVIETSKKQNESFKTYSYELKKQPLNFHFPPIFASNDLERIVKSDTLELYHSFMLFDKNNPNKFKNYRNIFYHVDFLQKFYSDLLLSNERHQNFVYSNLKVIEDNLQWISIKIALLQQEIQHKDPDVYNENSEFKFWEKYSNIYVGLKSTGFEKLELYKTQFLLPLQLELLKNISEQKLISEIIFQIANALIKMESISFNTFAYAADLADIDNEEEMKSALEFLLNAQDKIEKLKNK